MVTVTDRFLNTPLAELEAYGVSIKTIGALESCLEAIYVRDIRDVTRQDLHGTWIGPVESRCLRMGLEALRKDCLKGTDSRLDKFKSMVSNIKSVEVNDD